MHQRRSANHSAPTLLVVLRIIVICFWLRSAQAQPQLALQFTPANTSVKFTIADIVHTIHGSFQLKRGEVDYGSGSASVQGALVVDATSGRSGNRLRDHRMHHVVLDSSRYPEIVFRPDHVDGTIAPSGLSNLQVHGVFSIHGADHEMIVPIRLQLSPGHWIMDAHFNIPYVRWGMKNPSSLLLRVSESVEIDVHATGSNPFSAAGIH